MSELKPTDRTALGHASSRGTFDRESIYAILDEGLVAHVGFVDRDQPFVLPMSYGRMGDRLVLHGGKKSRIMQVARQNVPLCVTVTLLDALVLAKSVMHHSMNYRSVVVFGTATELTGEDEKNAALRALVDHVVPGRWDHARPPSAAELNATAVLTLPLNEASAKARTGPPVDAVSDIDLPHWAGLIPLSPTPQEPIQADYGPQQSEPPQHVRDYRRPGTAR